MNRLKKWVLNRAIKMLDANGFEVHLAGFAHQVTSIMMTADEQRDFHRERARKYCEELKAIRRKLIADRRSLCPWCGNWVGRTR